MTAIINMIGNLTKDAVLDGKKCRFNLAVNTGFGDNQKTTFYVCTLWGSRGEKLADYLTKGSKVFVTGQLDTFQTQDNNTLLTCNVNEISFVSKPKSSNTTSNEPPAYAEKPKTTPQDPFDDDIPF